MASSLEEATAASTDEDDRNSARVDFSAIAHELRTPMAAIITLAEMIERETLGPLGDPRYGGYARDIRDSARLALEIVSDAIEDGAAGNSVLACGATEVDVGEVIARSVRMIEHVASDADVQLELHASSDHWLMTNGPALTQVLLNLLQNAVKFTATGGSVTVETDTTSTGELVIAVVDTGVGMTAADTRVLTSVNELPSLVTQATPSAPGTERRGIGFSLVRRLTAAMGAAFEVDSTRGVGTRVSLVFPAKQLVERP